MRGMKYDDLVAIVDFLYYGEANIYQENLDNFLNIAEELNLKGLNKEGSDETVEDSCLKNKTSKPKLSPPFITQGSLTNNRRPKTRPMNVDLDRSENHGIYKRSGALPKHDVSGDLEDLEKTVKSMMVLSDNVMPNSIKNRRPSICKVCGKEGKNGSIKDHIEANHIEGIVIPCNLCEKTFRSRASRIHHKIHQHLSKP